MGSELAVGQGEIGGAAPWLAVAARVKAEALS